MKLLRIPAAFLFALVSATCFAATTVGPWVPKFKGIDFSVSSNTPPGTFPNRQVVSAFRIDLTDPDIKLFTTPRRSPYVEGRQEVGGLTVSDFVKTYGVQAGINANFFDTSSYYLPAFTPMDVYGLAISQGEVVSPQDDRTHAAALLFEANNSPNVIYTNYPAKDTTGVYTAVAGNYPLVINGVSVPKRTGALERDPRTAFGISEDKRYLYLVGIDGRQPGYSDGAYDYETAGWLLLLGAHDGVNMDGGGSTTLVIQNSTGKTIRMNKSSAVADSGKERTVGSHLGIFAKPLPGFINDIGVVPDDTTAVVSWSTLERASSKVEFGLTESLGSATGETPDLSTTHSVQLNGLTPGAHYYFHVISSTASTQYISPTYVFNTTNYLATNLMVETTSSWKYTFEAQAGTDWIAEDFDDSSWTGPGPGLLWADVRGPNELVGPLNTQMEIDQSTGYPYVTYYFRTHFSATNVSKVSALALSALVDDGLVVYLNGSQIWRLRVPFGATSTSLATGYGCDGDATCAEETSLKGVLSNLVDGDNVLAVEVHNYNARSADITFGLAVGLIEPVIKSAAQLTIESAGENIVLRWEAPEFHLQSTPVAEGPWVNETLTSPATITPGEAQRFYRLAK